jgi:hypothetical protein
MRHVQGQWVVPNVDAPTQNQWYYCSSWIGLDGDESSDVCQAGVECDVYHSGSSITRQIYPWLEWAPLAEVQITNLAVSPGDLVFLLLKTSGAGATEADVYFANLTSGGATSLTFSAPSGIQLVGNCAEWIVERPNVGGSTAPLADYGQVFFSKCKAGTTSGTGIEPGSGNNINMSDGSSVISEADLLTSYAILCGYEGALPSA